MPSPDPAPSSVPNPFLHGVASGDPLADRVILWTRVTTLDRSAEVDTHWEIALDPQLRQTVSRGTRRVTAATDHTLKIDVTGLSPGQAYYYRFEAAGHRSAIGRTRTAPTGSIDRLRLATASCSNYPYGYFNVYGAIARRNDLHAVLHLGDYLYEYENGRYGDGTPLSREPDPVDREIVSLADYRARHAIYKTDPDLQEVHRQHPVIAIWDDHEFTNDAWWGGAQNHQPEEGDWPTRRAAAIRAYREWMPIRDLPTDDTGQIHRRLRFGNLLDLVMLDTRLRGRDLQADWRQKGYESIVANERRSLLGRPQEAWLATQLERSRDDGIAWRVLGQQVMLSQLKPRSMGDWVNTDMWDGYAPARRRLLDHVAGAKIEDLIVLTGDIHSSWGLEVTADPFGRRYDPVTGRGAVAVEFVTPSVSSPSPVRPDDALAKEEHMRGLHPHLRYVELRHRGYTILDIDHDRTVCEWHHVDGVDERRIVEQRSHALATTRGQAHLTPVEAETPAMADAPAPAPREA